MSSTTVRPRTAVPAIDRARARLEEAWHRVDRALIRLGGRVDTPSYDQWLPYAYAALHAALLIALALARYRSQDHGLETAKYAQAVWQIGEGLKPTTTLAGGNILAEQASVVLYPVSILTAIFPPVETLIVIKALALAAASIPLWRLARRHGQLGIGASSAVVFAYCFYTYVHNMNVADFSPAILAVPAFMLAVLAGFDERMRTMVAALVFVLCCRADLGLAAMGLGVLLMLEKRRRFGVVALALGSVWFLAAMYGLQRWLGDGSYDFLTPYASFGSSPHGVLGGILANPIRFVRTVGSFANFQILVTLLAPVLFLPLTAPRFLMPAVPLYVLYMGADVPVGRLREAAQTVPLTVFVFVATVFALRQTGRVLVKRVRVERRVILALVLTATVFFIRDSASSPYSSPWDWGGRDLSDQARLRAVDALPDDTVPVRASASVLPLLSERLGVYALDTSGGVDALDQIVESAIDRVDWLIVDRDAESIDSDIGRFRTRMADQGWQLVAQPDGSSSRIDIYRFTGIVATVPLPEE